MMASTMTRGSVVSLSMLGLWLLVQCCTASLILPGPPPKISTTQRPKVPATYWVTFPTRIRPGMRLPVTVHLARAGDSATVSVKLTNNSDHSVVFSQAPPASVVGGGNSHIIYLEIPTDLKRPDWRHWFQYAVQVLATGDVSFNKSQVVNLYEKAFSIFVQTDKAIYKPGQTVKFRALAMNPDLTILNEPMDIFIKDSLGNGIKRWTNVQGYQNTGVVERSMPTSTDPTLGDWEIEVTLRGQTETKKFTIDKYVLPKFEAELDVPKVVVTSEPGLGGKTLAKYTFGKPLTGAAVTVTVKYDYFWKKNDNMQQPVLTQNGTLDNNGELAFFFANSDLIDLTRKNYHYKPEHTVTLDWKRVKVTAEVTDVRTGRKMEAENFVRFSRYPAKVEFLPLTPRTYKPGLRHTAYVKVTQADGTLFPNYQAISVVFNVTMSVPVVEPTPPHPLSTKPVPTRLWIRPFPYYRPEKEVPLFTVTKQLTENGFLSVDVDVPAEAKRVTVKVETMGVTDQRSAQKAASRSGNYLQITGQQHSPKVGHMAKLHVRATEPVNKVTYQVYTKGVMISESEASPTDAEGQKFIISFMVTANMAPNCRVLVFYLRSDGEVVADSLSFKVDVSSADQVGVSYGRQKVKPGGAVQMTVTARPNSVVFVLAVDKSVQLLKSGNDITQDMVSEELVGYDFGGGYHGYWRYMFICGWPYPSHGVDASSIFRDAGVAMLTDGDLYQKPYEYARFRGPVLMAAGYAAGSSNSVDFAKDSAPPASPAERVRNFFPETWLWDMLLIGPSGQLTTKTVVPDTITTWLTSAFAVHPQHGLSVIQQPTELTTFKDLFVTLDLPYSAIRGEDLCMKAFAFNYHAQSTDLTMVMDATPGIDNIRVRRGRVSRNSTVVTRPLGQAASNEVKETLYCFTPRGLGRFPIRVNLSSSVPSADAVERMLLVEAEGTPRATNIPVILDVKPNEVFQREVAIRFPSDTVQGSQRITVSVAGDLLGPVFENVDDLLRMPYGCGEQNMLYFAPNVFLIDYLQKTNTYTPERAEKAENYMLVGYQKEIRYQHDDGSFSAFGNRHKNETGSMWLTAFVVKCFAQSMALQGDVVTIEPRILQKAVSWMISRQRRDGAFDEPGKVFNRNMQGGSAKGEALTAYVIIALAETDRHFTGLSAEDRMKLQGSLSRGRAYLEQQLSSLNDSYDIAIVTYALHITSSRHDDRAFQLLMSKAIHGSLTLHWERPKRTETQIHYYWQRQTNAINIEMTSYALLTFVARSNVVGGLPIVRWMTLQRGSQGGFISTQDTVVGLQALAQVATEIYRPTSSPITVTVIWMKGQQEQSTSLTLNDTTRGLLQKMEVPLEDDVIPSNISIRASTPQQGTVGFAVAEVLLKYNVLQDALSSPFLMSAEARRVDDSNVILEIWAVRADRQEGGMTVMDVGLLTGYDVNEDSPQYDIATAKEAERNGRHYIIYFDQLGGTPVTVTLPLVLTHGIPVNPKPGVVRIYDYYENGGDQEITMKYSLQAPAPFCVEQPTYEECGLPSYRRLETGSNRFQRQL